jgi:hypothetical protein
LLLFAPGRAAANAATSLLMSRHGVDDAADTISPPRGVAAAIARVVALLCACHAHGVRNTHAAVRAARAACVVCTQRASRQASQAVHDARSSTHAPTLLPSALEARAPQPVAWARKVRASELKEKEARPWQVKRCARDDKRSCRRCAAGKLHCSRARGRAGAGRCAPAAAAARDTP